MAITYRTVATAVDTTSPWAATVTKPASLANGDLMVAFCGNYQNNTAFTAPSGWTSIRSYSITNLRVQAFYKHVTTASSEPASYAFTNAAEVHLYVVYGHQPSSPVDDSAQGVDIASNTYVEYSGLAATLDGTLAIKMAGTAHTRATTNSPGTGWTARATTAATFSATKAFNTGSVNGNGADTYVIQSSTSGSTSGGIFVIIKPVVNGLVSPPTAIATGSAETPTVSVVGNAIVTGVIATATAGLLTPTAVAAAQVGATAMAATAGMLAPVATGAALVVAATATAAGGGLAPELVYDAIVAATVAGASAALVAPVVAGGAVATAAAMDAAMTMAAPTITGAALLAAAMASATATASEPTLGQSIVASLMSATMMAHGSEARGGALVSPDVSAVIASIHTPLPQLIYSVPLMSMSASAFEATALGSAVTTTLLGVATASAVAPKAGVLRTTSAWRGNRMSVNGRVNTGSVTTRPSSSAQVTRNTNDASSTLRAGVTVSPSSPSGVTATQQERDE